MIGILKLSTSQAECRHAKNAVLCLKYIVMLSLTALLAATAVQSGSHALKAVLTVCAVLGAVITAGLRGSLHCQMYRISEGYLRCPEDGEVMLPSFIQLMTSQLVYAAAVWTVNAVMLSPSYLCLRAGIQYYSLSSERTVFMLMLGAALCLAAGGAIFAAVIRARLTCAQYLWFCGECAGMLSAIDRSWELTQPFWGELLRLAIASRFCGAALGSLNTMNASQTVLRQSHPYSDSELEIDIFSDTAGEQHIDLITV